MAKDDPTGEEYKIHLNGEATIGFFSTEFKETCQLKKRPGLDIATSRRRRERARDESVSEIHEKEQMRYDPNITLGNYSYINNDFVDNPYAGAVFNKDYLQTNKTIDFTEDWNAPIYDKDIGYYHHPLPHNRTQVCHFAIRLTPPNPGMFGAAWAMRKQLVLYGFETSFYFQIVHRSMDCAAGDTEDSGWCHREAADGFAFVVHNAGYESVGNDPHGMAYTIPHSLAVEFDTKRQAVNKDLTSNHIAVMVPSGPGALNSPSHERSAIAYSDEIPDIGYGTHFVKIKYDVHGFSWDQMYGPWGYDLDSLILREHSAGRMGMLTVELDDHVVLSVAVSLMNAVHADGVETYEHDLDPKGLDIPFPGKAYVGFSSSTGEDDGHQSVDILQWDYNEVHRCIEGDYFHRDRLNQAVRDADLAEFPGVSHCHVTPKWTGVQPCRTGWKESPYCEISVRNIGRSPIRISAKLEDRMRAGGYTSDTGPLKSYVDTECTPSVLQYDHIHPYFLGCTKLLRMLSTTQELRFSSLEGDRHLVVADKHVLNLGHNTGFKRRALFEYCMKEHPTDPYRYQFAMCNCEYCTRLLDISALFAVFYEHKCSALFGTRCTCFEVSEMQHDFSRPLPFLRLSACKGCSYDSHCNFLLKGAYCPLKDPVQRVGNPLAPTIVSFGLENFERDEGRVVDGHLSGDVCKCEAPSVFRDTTGKMQVNNVYLRRTVQVDEDRCFQCLHLYEETNCHYFCGPPSQVTYVHYPAGPQCATCIYAGSRLLELTYTELADIKACVDRAIGAGEDPWVTCEETAQSMRYPASSYDYFNGVTTHYLAECPGRDFADFGAICVPNYYAKDFFPSQVMSRFSALKNQVWAEEHDCLDAECNVRSRDKCYTKLARWRLTSSAGLVDDLHDPPLRLEMPDQAPSFAASGLVFDKVVGNYAITEPLPFNLEEKSLEVWLTVDPSERVTNALTGAPSVGSTNWRTSYEPSLAIDGKMDTYWSSQVGKEGKPGFRVNWEVDLKKNMHSEGLDISWKHAAYRFSIFASEDQETWREVAFVDNNFDAFTGVRKFFFARYLRIEMVRALAFRDKGPGDGLPVYSIKEIVVRSDTELSRLKKASSMSRWQYDIRRAYDGNEYTYWATEYGTKKATLVFDFGKNREGIAGIRVSMAGFLPRQMSIRYRAQGGAEVVLVSLQGAAVIPVIEPDDVITARIVYIVIDESGYDYNMQIAKVAEVEIYNIADNVAPEGTLTVETTDEDLTADDILAGLDNRASSSFTFYPGNDPVTFTLELPREIWALRVNIEWQPGAGPLTWFLDSSVSGDFDDTFALASIVNSQELTYTRNGRLYIRALRINVQRVNPQNIGGVLGMAEWFIYESSENLPSAPGTTVTADGWEGDTMEQAAMVNIHSPSAAVDGTIDTWFGAEFGSNRVDLIIDLGARFPIDCVRIVFMYTARSVYVGGSGDKLVWNQIFRTQNNTAYDVIAMTDNSVKLRYLKVQISNPTDTYNSFGILGMKEVYAFSKYENVVLRKDITSEPEGSADGSSLRGAIDGWEQSYWLSHLGTPTATLTVDFGRNRQIKEVYILWYLVATSFALETGIDAISLGVWGIQWTELYSVVGSSTPEVTVSELWNGRYFRIQFRTSIDRNEKPIDQHGVADLTITATDGGSGRPISTKLSGNNDGTNTINLANDFDPALLTYWRSQEFPPTPTEVRVDLGSTTYVWGVKCIWNKWPKIIHVEGTTKISAFDTLFINENHEGELFSAVFEPYPARWIRLMLLELGDEGLFTAQFTSYELITFEIYDGPNVVLGMEAVADYPWSHTGMSVVDGNESTFWLSEFDATSASVTIDLGEEYFIAKGIVVEWKFPAEEFALYRSYDGVSWAQLPRGAVTGNTAMVSTVSDIFQARYVQLRMTLPAPNFLTERRPMYGITALRVLFDVNLCHGRVALASSTADAELFGPRMAIDPPVEGEVPGPERFWRPNHEKTIWIARAGTNYSVIEFLLTDQEGFDVYVGGLSIMWRYAPADYHLLRWNRQTDRWERFQCRRTTAAYCIDGVVEWVDNRPAENSDQQTNVVREGFNSRSVRLVVTQANQYNKLSITALRDFRMAVADLGIGNVAYKQFATASHEEQDKEADKAVDNNVKGTYWAAPYNVKPAWFRVELAQEWEIALVNIDWRNIATHFTLSVENSEERFPILVYTMNDPAYNATTTTIFLWIKCRAFTIDMYEGGADPFGFLPEPFFAIREVMVWPAKVQYPIDATVVENPLTLSNSHLIDHDIESYWMGPVNSKLNAWVRIDLGLVYAVERMEIWWAFRPVNYEIWYTRNENPNFIRGDDQDAWAREWMRASATMDPKIRNLERVSTLVDMRYLLILISTGYRDEEGMIGTAIRNIALYNDLNFARGLSATSDSTWDYSVANLNDNDLESYWAGQWGQEEASLVFTLPILTNMAGIRLEFKYLASDVLLSYSESEEDEDWVTIIDRQQNTEYTLEVPSDTMHFRAKRFKLSLVAGERIPDPDDWENPQSHLPQLGVYEVQLLEHTGGGGVFGVETLNGQVYDTIVYAQREPRQWASGSEGDRRTADAAGEDEQVGSLVQVVVAYGRENITLFRNGKPYGMPYPAPRMQWQNGSTRIVLGVRSTAYVEDSENYNETLFTLDRFVGKHALTHNPFFSGTIQMATIIRGELLEDEVRGLYEAQFGGRERGCHCHDACRVSYNQFHPDVPIPCGGHGVCLVTGQCQCLPGYWGRACENHCTLRGCCTTDDDCLPGLECDLEKTMCTPKKEE
jgi:hypothetical protein